MPRYVLLVDWTAQRVRAAEHTVDRLEQGSELAESFGCTNRARLVDPGEP
jgi:uncharacterized protein with GYD domain